MCVVRAATHAWSHKRSTDTHTQHRHTHTHSTDTAQTLTRAHKTHMHRTPTATQEYTAWGPTFLSDGLHLTPDGNALLAKLLLELIEKELPHLACVLFVAWIF